MSLPFNSKIDKITERELVFDIIERETLGKDLTNDDGDVTFWKAGTFITAIWRKLVMMLPPTITLNFLKVKVGVIDIPIGSKGGTVNISGLENNQILLAQSQQTGIDIKECINTTVSGNNMICTLTTDVAYSNEDHIKIYAY